MEAAIAAPNLSRLELARRGDESAFQALVEPLRGELLAHCYRMLGSLHDAEDALQEALLRAWRGLARFEGRSSLRSWLHRIATNTCLDTIARRPKRVLPIHYGDAADPAHPQAESLSEPVWIEPFPDERLAVADGSWSPDARYEQRESVELAFVAALQHLPPRQRAALVLREVLGFSARETAESLDTTVASVNSLLQRARATLDSELPDQSQAATLRALGDERLREIVNSYVDAMERDDVDAVVAMLTEDASWSMPPKPTWYRGRAAIAAFLRRWPLAGDLRWRDLPVRVNGQVAFGRYIWDRETERWVAFVIDVLTFRGSEIASVTAFLGGDWFPRVGLPTQLPPQTPAPA